MPKFITYQRPAPVNKAAWNGGKPGNPYAPVRRPQLPPPPKSLPALTVRAK